MAQCDDYARVLTIMRGCSLMSMQKLMDWIRISYY